MFRSLKVHGPGLMVDPWTNLSNTLFLTPMFGTPWMTGCQGVNKYNVGHSEFGRVNRVLELDGGNGCNSQLSVLHANDLSTPN